MRVIGVLDIRNGRAVHARGGRRAEYAPVEEAAGVTVNGDAVALAQVYVELLGVRELYVADLDAIGSGPAAMQARLTASVGALGAPVWLDAGVSSVDGAMAALAAGATKLVVGLETLADFGTLDDICAAVGGAAVAFSIDLRAGEPVTRANAMRDFATVEALAARAVDAGVGALVVLDLARVGSGAGPDLATIAAVRAAAPNVVLLAGGGVRDTADLHVLADAGCDGALVATALLDGRLGAAELEWL